MANIELNNLIFPDTPELLRGMLLHCGCSSAHYHNYVWDGMERGPQEMTIWQYTLAGEGALDYNGRTYRVRPGEAMLLIVPEKHRYYLPADSDNWEFLYVSVYGHELLRIFEMFRQRHGVICDFPAHSRVVDVAYDLIHRVKNHEIQDSYAASAAAYEFIMALCASTSGKCIDADYKWLKAVQEYCAANLHKPITVDDLAAIAGCSRCHFSRRFAKLSGFTPHDYIMDLKMRKAIRLLASPLSVKEIADELGFANSAYFCRAFRRAFNVSPGQFRHGNGN